MDNEITITVTRGTSPVLITGDPIVVEAVLSALDRALRGPERARVLRLARDMDPDGDAASQPDQGDGP